jgi:hypothetical protein
VLVVINTVVLQEEEEEEEEEDDDDNNNNSNNKRTSLSFLQLTCEVDVIAEGGVAVKPRTFHSVYVQE